MPRKKPTTKIDVIGNFDLYPEKAVDQYFESKQYGKSFIKEPNWDTPDISLELKFIKSKREHEACLELQAELLKHAREQSAINATRIDELASTQTRLRQRFIDVNDFIKDCGNKKRGAVEKINETTRLHGELERKIEESKKAVQELADFKEIFTAIVKECEPYEHVLNRVVEKSSVFNSVKDCVDRCDALTLAHLEIARLEKQKLLEVDEMRTKMAEVANEAAVKVLGLRNEFSRLAQTYDEARSECLKWERILEDATNFAATNELNKNRVLDSIYHMYQLLCRRRKIDAKFLRHEVEKQLDFIRNEVEILQEVYRECSMPTESQDTDEQRITGY